MSRRIFTFCDIRKISAFSNLSTAQPMSDHRNNRSACLPAFLEMLARSQLPVEFGWIGSANEVFVAGSFNEWNKSQFQLGTTNHFIPSISPLTLLFFITCCYFLFLNLGTFPLSVFSHYSIINFIFCSHINFIH